MKKFILYIKNEQIPLAIEDSYYKAKQHIPLMDTIENYDIKSCEVLRSEN